MRRTATLRHQRGATLVEYALVLSAFVWLVIGILEFGRVIFTYNTLTNAAREGARYGIIHHQEGEAGVESAVRALTTGLDGARLAVDVTWPPPKATWPKGTVQVKVTYQLDLLTGRFIDEVFRTPTITLRAASTMRFE